MINMGELFAHDRISNIEMERVQLNEAELSSMLVEPGDLLFARQSLVLAGAGKCSIVVDASEPTTFESHLIRVRLKRDIAEPVFFHYYFKSPASGMTSIVTQGVQAGIRGSDLKRLPVRVPPRLEQKRIAQTLAAYDDLIENNLRRIGLLEEAARMLYREWFVHFRFPGHEHVKIIDGRPEGWKVAPIRETYFGLFDGPHATPAPTDEGPVFLGIRNIRETGGLDLSSIRHVSEAEFPKWTRRVTPREGDIVFSYEATLNRYALIPRDLRCCLGRRMALIRPRDEYRLYLYLYLLSENWRRVIGTRTIKGATVDRIPLTTFPGFPVLLPERKVSAAFANEIEPYFKLFDILREQNQKLSQARDLLLPRLMSGEIAV